MFGEVDPSRRIEHQEIANAGCVEGGNNQVGSRVPAAGPVAHQLPKQGRSGRKDVLVGKRGYRDRRQGSQRLLPEIDRPNIGRLRPAGALLSGRNIQQKEIRPIHSTGTNRQRIGGWGIGQPDDVRPVRTGHVIGTTAFAAGRVDGIPEVTLTAAGWVQAPTAVIGGVQFDGMRRWVQRQVERSSRRERRRRLGDRRIRQPRGGKPQMRRGSVGVFRKVLVVADDNEMTQPNHDLPFRPFTPHGP